MVTLHFGDNPFYQSMRTLKLILLRWSCNRRDYIYKDLPIFKFTKWWGVWKCSREIL